MVADVTVDAARGGPLPGRDRAPGTWRPSSAGCGTCRGRTSDRAPDPGCHRRSERRSGCGGRGRATCWARGCDGWATSRSRSARCARSASASPRLATRRQLRGRARLGADARRAGGRRVGCLLGCRAARPRALRLPGARIAPAGEGLSLLRRRPDDARDAVRGRSRAVRPTRQGRSSAATRRRASRASLRAGRRLRTLAHRRRRPGSRSTAARPSARRRGRRPAPERGVRLHGRRTIGTRTAVGGRRGRGGRDRVFADRIAGKIARRPRRSPRRPAEGVAAMPAVPPEADIDRIERALGWRPDEFRRASEHRGTSGTAARWIVATGPRSAFVKVGATELTAGWTRTEHSNYGAIGGWYMPRVLGIRRRRRAARPRSRGPLRRGLAAAVDGHSFPGRARHAGRRARDAATGRAAASGRPRRELARGRAGSWAVARTRPVLVRLARCRPANAHCRVEGSANRRRAQRIHMDTRIGQSVLPRRPRDPHRLESRQHCQPRSRCRVLASEPSRRGCARRPRRSFRQRRSSRRSSRASSAAELASATSRTLRMCDPCRLSSSRAALPWAARALGLPAPW